MYVIEQSVPMPAAKRRGRPAKWPFGTMKRGECVRVLDRKEEGRAVAAAEKWRERHPGWNFVTDRQDGWLRIWRKS